MTTAAPRTLYELAAARAQLAHKLLTLVVQDMPSGALRDRAQLARDAVSDLETAMRHEKGGEDDVEETAS